MSSRADWRRVYDFWFPIDLSQAEIGEHWRMLLWWMRGGANAELGRGRLSLILVLDQFPRGLFAGSPEAYACDQQTLKIAKEGFRNGHYEALTSLYEKFFYFLPLAHAEGPDHLERLKRIVAVSEQAIDEAPEHLKPVWQFSLSQAQANLEVICRFGRFPHRNEVLGRASTADELVYLAKGDFVHMRSLPASASTAIIAIG